MTSYARITKDHARITGDDIQNLRDVTSSQTNECLLEVLVAGAMLGFRV